MYKNAIWWKISAECVPLLREARPISSILRPVYSKLVLTLFQLKVVSWRFEKNTDKLGVRVSAEYGLIYAKTRQTCSKSGLIRFWFNFGKKNHDKNAIWENIHRMCAFYEHRIHFFLDRSKISMGVSDTFEDESKNFFS